MHPSQQEMVDADYKGPAKLLGVSGSGKTCVVVRRAIRLSSLYPDKRILIVTLNRSLAMLINDLVGSYFEEGERNNIEVMPFFKVCQKYLFEIWSARIKSG